MTNSDGHPISYQVEPRNVGHQYVGGENEPWTQNQLYITVNKLCERLASQNSQASPCGSDVSQFVDGELLSNADVVLWYGASSHRLITDEDEPVKPTQWLSFQIIPRDWTAENALVE
jgi:primary-amine oxidase